ncbi:MAG: C-GCAxxG-C-C family protein [Proteobacteria bacterium]|nr:C-GCAxxG-C-C family protein [Pseudomonadota bacterium]
MSELSNKAVARFQEGFSCSQAVFSVFAEKHGLDRETALRISGAFGGGMARMGLVCGAVTGAFMVIGLKYGKTEAKDEEAKEKTYQQVKNFVERFRAANGSMICKELLGFDLSVPKEAAQAKEKGLFKNLCPRLVKDAVEILEEMLGAGC